MRSERQGFFYKKADLTAWDSLAAHSKGLERLANKDLFLKPRNRTRTEKISIPYRHGIMHGMDLGYDNKLVAAKTWAALFAVGEWARKAEGGELKPPPEEPEPTFLDMLREVVERYEEIEETKRQINKWEPRGISVEEDIPSKGEPDEYEKDTPERALVEFLSK